jgi:hypothetical protein
VIPLPPWANGPFELLVHAEGHLRGGDDFDRRISLISFDNAIEVAITTYLTLNPIQRSGRSYPKADVEKWLDNYHSKLDFLGQELASRKLPWLIERSHIVWVHDHRNAQYHGGQKGTPERHVLILVRKSALWIFSFLFDVADVEQRLEQAIIDSTAPAPPQRDVRFDRAIDRVYGMVDVCDETYYASELLFSVDYTAYRDQGTRLCSENESSESGEQEK